MIEQIKENLREDECCSYSNSLTLFCSSVGSPFMQKIKEEPWIKDDDTSYENKNLIGEGFKVYNNPLGDEIGEDFKVFFNPSWFENINGKVVNENYKTREPFSAINVENIELNAEYSDSKCGEDKYS